MATSSNTKSCSEREHSTNYSTSADTTTGKWWPGPLTPQQSQSFFTSTRNRSWRSMIYDQLSEQLIILPWSVPSSPKTTSSLPNSHPPSDCSGSPCPISARRSSRAAWRNFMWRRGIEWKSLESWPMSNPTNSSPKSLPPSRASSRNCTTAKMRPARSVTSSSRWKQTHQKHIINLKKVRKTRKRHI